MPQPAFLDEDLSPAGPSQIQENVTSLHQSSIANSAHPDIAAQVSVLLGSLTIVQGVLNVGSTQGTPHCFIVAASTAAST